MSTQTRPVDIGTLGLGSVLIGSLPATLLTADAPERYTVEAVFTRKPDPDEVALVLGNDTRDHLSRAGYAMVHINVSDRRLEIANTNLEELRDGLSGVVATRLAEISSQVQSRREDAAAQFLANSAVEHDRAAKVAALAESVTFDAAPRATHAEV
jgi:hypothetical protein